MPQILQYILTIGGVIGVLAYLYGQIFKSKNESKFDTIKLLKEQVQAMEEKMDDQDIQIGKLREEIKSLHDGINEKDRKLTETLAILQGRDPQMQELLKQLTDYITIGKPLMDSVVKDVIPVVSKLDKFLNKQTF